MPAEWERHEATWLTWPHFEGTWPGNIEPIPAVYVEMVRALHTGEAVHINVLDEERREVVERLLREADITRNVQLHIRKTDNEWIRDYGALTVRNPEGERIATDWKFNNWGEKYPDFALNNEIPAFMADVHRMDRHVMDLVMEGGSIEVNGRGMLITTESCLLNPNRNPHLSEEQIEQALKTTLGVTEIIWLSDGVEGDDTDGHIDDITRFIGENTVVTMVENDPADPNHEPLNENLKRLRTVEGLRVIPLPMPQRIDYNGERLPASYANFYIGNDAILLPVFNDPADEKAIQVLQEAFPDRRIAAIDARELIWGFGAFHCLTQQVPAGK